MFTFDTKIFLHLLFYADLLHQKSATNQKKKRRSVITLTIGIRSPTAIPESSEKFNNLEMKVSTKQLRKCNQM